VFGMTDPFDLVLEQQFTPFEFHNFQIIDRGMRLAIVYFFVECPVLLFKFRKMRLHRHAECLLNLWIVMMMFGSLIWHALKKRYLIKIVYPQWGARATVKRG
jgi:hypothetical protein